MDENLERLRPTIERLLDHYELLAGAELVEAVNRDLDDLPHTDVVNVLFAAARTMATRWNLVWDLRFEFTGLEERMRSVASQQVERHDLGEWEAELGEE